jgi:hypothetical protein
MRRSLLLLSCLLIPLSGCTLCASPYDCDYGLYGGSWPRHEMAQGRVGSKFHGAGSSITPHVPEAIEPPGEPTPNDSPVIPSPLRPGAEEDI